MFMPLEEGLNFIGKLLPMLHLTPQGTPEHPASLFSHPIVLAAENLAKSLDMRLESYALTEHEEERKRQLMSGRETQNLMVTAPGNQLPFKPDPRIILPYSGQLDDMKFSIGVIPDTYLVWKKDKKRLYGIFAATVEEETNLRGPTRSASAIVSNSSAIYFENGVIFWFSMFDPKPPAGYIICGQYFVPPEMDVPMARPPYRGFNRNLSHPSNLKDMDILITQNVERVSSEGVGYLAREMRRDLTKNAKLVMMFAEAHKQLYSI